MPGRSLRLVIRGVARDVTDFRHPGGDTIAHYQDGQDATDAFETFHRRSSVAEQRLRSLPVVKDVIIAEPAPAAEIAGQQPLSPSAGATLDAAGAAISRDFGKLREELSAEGLFSLQRYPTLHFVGCYLLHDIALYALALYLVASGWVACGMLMRAFAHVQRGGTMHDLAHNEVFAKSRAADLCYMVYCTLAMGFSAHEWRTKHNRHHTSPNMEGFDGNVEQLPLFGWNSGWTKRMTARMQKLQLYVWYAVTPLLGLVMQVRGLLWARRHGLTTELQLMTAHFIIDYTLFGYCLWLQPGLSAGLILGYYLLSQGTAGVYIHLIFMYNHQQLPMMSKAMQHLRDPCFARLQVRQISFRSLRSPLAPAAPLFPVTRVGRTNCCALSAATVSLTQLAALEHSVLQVLTCVNYSPHPLTAYLTLGLNFQVEHHLFPEMPRRNLRAIQSRVEGLCRKHALPYRVCTHFEAMAEMNHVLRQASEIEDGFPWMNHLIAEHLDCMAE